MRILGWRAESRIIQLIRMSHLSVGSMLDASCARRENVWPGVSVIHGGVPGKVPQSEQ